MSFYIEFHCEPNQFECDSGKCIMANFVCDGYHDCGASDMSDERNCTGKGTQLSYSTLTVIPRDKYMYFKLMVLSYITETECTPVREFSCVNPVGDLECIPATHVCDGHDDCGDGSDEVGCG